MIDIRHIMNCYDSRDREALERYLIKLAEQLKPKPVNPPNEPVPSSK